ncbi:MAG: GIY-YIG nuclease family protein [Marinobacter sp.]|uniref:GIY-YIG nuclease family protein n=1 Tax=Marinobacter sp. TaxID=50741 RepID=UPI00299DFD20|nr:GIY-YIG nuclease family protein [Marinobacter sp.]MDX1756525.1 GIY-YIG nuclease family protein [Marinobacter sp.]
MSGWHLYLVRTASGQLYTGITTDVTRRFAEHQAGAPKGARSLRGKGPLSLAFSVAVGSRSDALRLEWQVKRWRRARKEALIRGDESLPVLSDAGESKAGPNSVLSD